MNKFTLLVVFTLLLCLTTVSAQDKYTLSGYVRDGGTGEELIGATVRILDLENTGAATNAYGFFSITLPEGEYRIAVQFVGFVTVEDTILLTEDKRLDFNLIDNTTLNEVVVEAERQDQNVTDIQMGVDKLDMREINKVPVLMGEKDVLKTIQLRPGVKNGGEGTGGFFVRGGAADQNLILLDEATVYNVSHLLGFFSVFNSDALKDVTLYKGTQPAEFGGRLASVLDVRMKDGNMKRFGVSGGIGLISARLNVEGPIVKDKGSFSIAGRRTYADLFLKLSREESLKNSQLYFYDLNLKANYKLNERNRIYLSGYFGRDVLGFQKVFGLDWGNATGTLRWNSLVSEKLFSNTTFIFSEYNYKVSIDFAGNNAEIVSRIQNYNLKQDFQYFINSENKIKFGINSIFHRILPGKLALENQPIANSKENNRYAWDNAAYISHEWKPFKRVGFEYGARLSTFTLVGRGDFYSYNEAGNVTDTTRLGNAEFGKTYVNIEPRVGINLLLSEKNSLKAFYGRNTQNLHLLSNSTTGSPTDLWIPSSYNVRPEISDQVSLGYFRNFLSNKLELSVETYYKWMQNQIDYKDGAELDFGENVESQLLTGTGRAYGIEFLFRKKVGKITGWVGYTLSRVEKKIEGINNDEYYPARQDRTHDISIVLMYQILPRLSVAATWVYYTGNAVTFPSGKYEIQGQVVNYYTERNAYRMPDYHRMDLGITFDGKKRKRFESSWNLSFYNLYARENAFTITFEEDPNDPSKTQAVQTSLFKIIPSITYNFKF
ncbi:TonB-dependent receptor [Wandonia haliotis]|uniref:TonB-dependent receptor n=1 Tax=Wandonia haliotis TaxID=574963 RepID=A0ABP3Y052_9FLAO